VRALAGERLLPTFPGFSLCKSLEHDLQNANETVMREKFAEFAAATARPLILLAALALVGLAACKEDAHAQGGVPLWTNIYSGGHGLGSAKAVAVDRSGNIFVTGWSGGTNGYDYATVAYSGAGAPLWTNRYHGPGIGSYFESPWAIAADSSGNVFVAGGGVNDYATIKYSNAGVPLWTNNYTGYNGPRGHEDGARGVALDSQGNVFVTGYSTLANSYSDYATIKYSNTGAPLWTNRYHGPGSGYDGAYAIAVDSGGNIFVTGESAGSGNHLEYTTIKYSNAGVPLWTNRYHGPGNFDDGARAIALDSSGNAFVTGYSTGAGGYDDYATVAYSRAGVPLWTNRYHGPGISGWDDRASAVAVDGDGNVFVTGWSFSDSGFVDYDYATVAYSGAGLPLWTNRYAGEGGDNDYAYALAVDSAGNVIVTGASYGLVSYDYATVAYSSAGVALWTNIYYGPANSSDYAYAIAVDRGGNVVVTGSDYQTIKYSSSVPPICLTIEADASGGYFLRFNAIPGSTYRLQRATDLAGPWLTCAPQTAPASGLVEFHDLFPPPGQGFYRTVQP